MGILNLSKAPQVTKTGIEGVQNQRNLVTVHSLMPTLNLKNNNKWKFKRYDNKCPALGRSTKKCLFMGTQHFTEMTGKCTGEGHRYCHNSRYFNVIFRTELSFIRVNISAFQIDFKTLKFKIAENSVQINVYSAVLQFFLPRFISSKKVQSYLTLDGKTKAT